MDEREKRVRELLARPEVQERLKEAAVFFGVREETWISDDGGSMRCISDTGWRAS